MSLEIEKLGLELFNEIYKKKRNIFSGVFWSELLLNQATKNAELRINLFRLINILPQLVTYQEVSFYIKYYLLQQSRSLPFVVKCALKLATRKFVAPVFAMLFQKSIKIIAGRFIISRDAEEITRQITLFRKHGISFTLDILGEDANTYFDAENYKMWYWWLIKNIPDVISKLKVNQNSGVINCSANLPVNISIKISSLVPHVSIIHSWFAVRCIRRQLIPLLEMAKQKNVEINLDLESFSLNEITYSLFESIIAYPNIAIVVQGYLKKSFEYLEKLLELAKANGVSIGIRLVKGAYWDFEVINASKKGFIAPVFTNKAQTDYNFELLTKFLINNLKYFRPAFGTHNIRSICHLINYAESKSISKNDYEIQMLYGMAEQERKVLCERGHRVRVYTPIGELLPGMAYLVRRLLENTSNSGFLKMSRKNKANKLSLLKDPAPYKRVVLVKNVNSVLNVEKNMLIHSKFLNCPFINFSRIKNRAIFRNEMKNWLAEFPVEVPVVLAGRPYSGGNVFMRACPDNFDGVIANVHLATLEQANRAVNIAEAYYPIWREVPISKRAFLLSSLANLIERDRFKLASLLCFEVSKTWAEADGDVAEAIDFCRYYAMQALQELVPRSQTNLSGETNVLQFDGRGPCVIISPWNFPLAILCGMSVAALVSGNPIIIKPAENASLVAFAFFELLIQAGFPIESCQFLPGKGALVGSYLVKHPKIAQIAFTGSNAVGLNILESAAKIAPGQCQIKRVICEMGGKNAIIVDRDADLEEALAGVIHSAFGFAGQKCSAASRILIHSKIYHEFLYKLIMYSSARIVGSALSPASFIPPVVDHEARNRLIKVIYDSYLNNNLMFAGSIPSKGLFVPMAIFEVKDSNNRLMNEEFFGPIIALLRISSFAEGLKIAVKTNFALSGSVFSRNPNHLKQASNIFRVGNLYLNRESTGAMVNRQPFGGFGMSGTGIKAGGPGYLLNFVDARVVTENTMRHGFASEFAQ